MLAGTLVTIIGLMPVGFAQSSAGEYCRDLFWVVFIALLISWIVAVTFTPFLGVKMLPNIPPMEGGYAEIYETPNYQRFRRLVVKAVSHKFLVAGVVVGLFVAGVFGMGLLEQQFFPNSDRTEILVDVTMPQGTSIEVTEGAVKKLEAWLKKQPEAKIFTSYTGGGAPRFFLAYNPELPNPNFAKIIVSTADEQAQAHLLARLRQQLADGLVPEARVRASRFVFGPYSPWPGSFPVSGPELAGVREVSNQILAKMQADPHTRQANLASEEPAPTVHFVLDQDRLRLIGLTSFDASQQIQFLTTGFSVTQVREDIRTVDVVARTSGDNRLDPTKLMNMTLQSSDGRSVPLRHVGKVEIRPEDPLLKRRDRVPTITVQCDIDDSLQPPEVTAELAQAFPPIIGKVPSGYSIESGANVRV